jgi:hypothetical protein
VTQPGVGDLMAQWKTMSDQFLKNWDQVYRATAGSAEGQAMTDEFGKNYVAARAAMAKAARETYGPIIEAVGAVPLSEFQRLADQVHTILLRLDKIDDALAGLAGDTPASQAKPKKRKK